MECDGAPSHGSSSSSPAMESVLLLQRPGLVHGPLPGLVAADLVLRLVRRRGDRPTGRFGPLGDLALYLAVCLAAVTAPGDLIALAQLLLLRHGALLFHP